MVSSDVERNLDYEEEHTESLRVKVWKQRRAIDPPLYGTARGETGLLYVNTCTGRLPAPPVPQQIINANPRILNNSTFAAQI
jgi:hypothetical protein